MWVNYLFFGSWLSAQCRVSLSAISPERLLEPQGAGFFFPNIDWDSHVGNFLHSDAAQDDLPPESYDASIPRSHIEYRFELPSDGFFSGRIGKISSRNPLKLTFDQMIEFFQQFGKIEPYLLAHPKIYDDWHLKKLEYFNEQLTSIRSNRGEKHLNTLFRKAFAYLVRSTNLSTAEGQLWIEAFATEMGVGIQGPRSIETESVVRYGLLNLQTKFSARSARPSPPLEMYAAALSKVLADRWYASYSQKTVPLSNEPWVSEIMNPGLGFSKTFGQVWGSAALRTLQSLLQYDPKLYNAIDSILCEDESLKLESMEALFQMCRKETPDVSAETKTAAFGLLSLIAQSKDFVYAPEGLASRCWALQVSLNQEWDASNHLKNQAIVFPHLFALKLHRTGLEKTAEITGHNFLFDEEWSREAWLKFTSPEPKKKGANSSKKGKAGSSSKQ